MAYTLKGKVTFISQEYNVQTKSGNMIKREVWVAPMRFDSETGDPTVSDDLYSVQIEFSRDNCKALENISVGNEVSIGFRLRGIVYEKDGAKRCITTLDGVSCSVISKAFVPEPQIDVPQQVEQPVVAQQPEPSNGLPF